MDTAHAYCPASISLVFRVHQDEDPVKTGSTGISFTVDRGVTVTAKKMSGPRHAVFFNDKPTLIPTVEEVITALTTDFLEVRLSSPLPLGCGFGLSGASALSTAFAVNTLMGVGESRLELFKIAHRAEIVHKTGLGTIATQSEGGFLVRTGAGIPGSSYALPLEGEHFFATIMGEIDTPSILTSDSKMTRVNAAAQQALDEVRTMRQITFAQILDISYEFATKTRLLRSNPIFPIIEAVRRSGGHATMAMLGQTIISTGSATGSGKATTIPLTIIKDTVRTLETV